MYNDMDYMGEERGELPQKVYLIELEGKRFSIGESDLTAELRNMGIDSTGLEKALDKAGFHIHMIHDGKTIALSSRSFIEPSHYYHIGVLAKRGLLKDFEEVKTT